jgi:hypothetical protein
MRIDLLQLSDTVIDEPTFVAFLHAMANEWCESEALDAERPSSPYGPTSLGWENRTFGSIMEAAAAWADASADGMPLYVKPANPWQRAAQILAMGKLYE